MGDMRCIRDRKKRFSLLFLEIFSFFEWMIEYRISTYDRMLQLVLAAAFSIGGIAAVIAGFHGNGSALPVAVLAIVLIPSGIFFYLETTRLRVTIDEQSITVTHAFSSRSILLDEIAGLRHGQKKAILLDLKSGGKNFKMKASAVPLKIPIPYVLQTNHQHFTRN
jgi:hypothetical protein